MRLFLVLLAVLLLAAPAVAAAQSPAVTPTAGIEDEDPGVVDDPGDAAEDDEVLQDEIPGDDSDYANYCDGDGDYSYYQYCYPSAPNPVEDGNPAGAGNGGGKKNPSEVGPDDVSGATAPVGVGTSLPRTGGEPLVLALLGLALISIGSGGRLILTRR